MRIPLADNTPKDWASTAIITALLATIALCAKVTNAAVDDKNYPVAGGAALIGLLAVAVAHWWVTPDTPEVKP